MDIVKDRYDHGGDGESQQIISGGENREDDEELGSEYEGEEPLDFPFDLFGNDVARATELAMVYDDAIFLAFEKRISVPVQTHCPNPLACFSYPFPFSSLGRC
ncbi:hypothetical protein [Halotalea alkalilenta]|uniref:hypothetical protein n=1 Tax=Halotalea alkalilenta TaxID=376489 RepID=UPI00138DE2AA|nr:hypothetical protein [Halotalea alkalilenta]